MYLNFDQLPDNSRLWVFQLNRFIDSNESQLIENALTTYLDEWNAHGKPLPASFKLIKNRFLVVAADESATGASGCSIDALTHVIKELQAQLKIDFFDRTSLVYLENENLKSEPINSFKDKIRERTLSPDTLIFNLVLQTKGQLNNQFLQPVKDSWVMCTI